MTDVLVISELIEGGLRRNTLTAVTLAKQIASGTGEARRSRSWIGSG